MMENNLRRRIESLEKTVARGRVVLACLASLLAVLVLVAQADPEPKALVGSSLTLVDKKGKARFRVQFDREGMATAPPTLQFIDAAGKTWLSAGLVGGRAYLKLKAVRDFAGAVLSVSASRERGHIAIGADTNGTSIDFNDELVTRLEMRSVRKGPVGVALADTKGVQRLFQLVGDDGAPSVLLHDKSGAIRTAVGSILVPATKLRTQAYGLTRLDAAGKVIWQAPPK